MPNDDPKPEPWPGDELMEDDEALWEGFLRAMDPEVAARFRAEVERDELLEMACPPWKMQRRRPVSGRLRATQSRRIELV